MISMYIVSSENIRHLYIRLLSICVWNVRVPSAIKLMGIQLNLITMIAVRNWSHLVKRGHRGRDRIVVGFKLPMQSLHISIRHNLYQVVHALA